MLGKSRTGSHIVLTLGRDFLLLIPADAPNLNAVLSYYSAVVTLSPEGDVQVGGETMQGLGTEQRFPTSFIGAIASIASPQNPYRAPRTTPRSSLDASSAPPNPVASSTPLPAAAESPPLEASASVARSVLTSFPDPGYFLAGGMAGLVSRTATAPLDRLKVYLIAQTGAGQETVQAAKQGDAVQVVKKASRPLVEASKALWKAGGMRSLFAGERSQAAPYDQGPPTDDDGGGLRQWSQRHQDHAGVGHQVWLL